MTMLHLTDAFILNILFDVATRTICGGILLFALLYGVARTITPSR